jgi:thiopeptide-type bacteriocin biosynthesis protein
MELSESVFWLDSVSAIEFLKYIPEESREAHRWLWGLQVMDDMLDDFQFSLQDKLNFVQTQRKLFRKEFNGNDASKKQIDGKWRESKSKLEAFLQGLEVPAFAGMTDLLIARKKSLAPIFSELSSNQKPSTDFISSHLHMMLNRLFPSNPREQEWILYEYLCRYYASVIARNNIVGTKILYD